MINLVGKNVGISKVNKVSVELNYEFEPLVDKFLVKF